MLQAVSVHLMMPQQHVSQSIEEIERESRHAIQRGEEKGNVGQQGRVDQPKDANQVTVANQVNGGSTFKERV